MAGPNDSTLQAQMRADPRIKAIVAQRRSGALSAAELRAMGYDVPDGYHYTFGGRAGMGTLMDNERGFIEKAAPITAIGMGAVAGAGAAGAIPGIGGVGAGGSGAAAGVAGVEGAINSAQGGAAGGGLLGWLKNPKNLVNLAPIVASLAANRGGPGNSGGVDDGFLRQAYDDAQRVNALKETRFRRVDPLHQAVTQLAFNRMPDSSRQGLNLNTLPLPPERT